MAFNKKMIETGNRLCREIAKAERKANLERANLYRKAEGKLVVVGWDIDRVMGIFSTLDKALEAVEDAPERYDHNWWLEFRKLDRWEKSNVFGRMLIRTKVARQVTKSADR